MATSGNLDAFLLGNAYLTSDSETVDRISYDPVAQELSIDFLKGNSGYYSGISPDEARAFAQAESQGIHLWQHLRNRKTWTPLTRYRKRG